MQDVKRKNTALRRETARAVALWDLMDKKGRLPTVTEVVQAVKCGRTTARKLRGAMSAAVEARAGRKVPLLAPVKKKLRRESDGNAPF